ncbi:MAG TPA: hypothetical protein VI814_13880 [Candidatus Limnocylindria bacterium]
MGVAFLLGLMRQRSLASAALLFLLLVDEIEGLVFVAVGVLLHRVDVFIAMQDAVFPAVVVVAGVASLARNWHRAPRPVALPEPEPLELTALAERIGAAR